MLVNPGSISLSTKVRLGGLSLSLFSSAIVRLVAVRSISIWVIDHPRGLLVKPNDSSSSAATVLSPPLNNC